MNGTRTCMIEGCETQARTKGMCRKHYKRVRTHGDPLKTLRLYSDGTCSLDGCDRVNYGKLLCRLHYDRVRSNGTTAASVLIGASVAERLAHYSRREGECVVWTGYRDKNGYGNIEIDKRAVRVPRVAWMEANGDIPEGLVVRHKCDNPPCFRVEHLELGTHYENAQDKVRRGRSLKGQDNPDARLTDEQAAEIYTRSAAGETRVSLAAEFGVGSSTVSRIANGRSWAHVTGAAA